MFLEDVRVPAENIVGAGERRLAADPRGARRTSAARCGPSTSRSGCRTARWRSPTSTAGCATAGRAARDLAALRDQVAQAYIESRGVRRAHAAHAAASSTAATPAPTPRCRSSSAARSSSARASCRCSSRAPYAQLGIGEPPGIDRGDWQERYLYSRSVTISSGTSEVLRTLLAQQALGLAAWLTSDAAKERRHEGSAQGLARP